MKRKILIVLIAVILASVLAFGVAGAAGVLNSADNITVTVTVPQSTAQISSIELQCAFDNTALEAKSIKASFTPATSGGITAVTDTTNANEKGVFAYVSASGDDDAGMASDLVLTAVFKAKKDIADTTGLIKVYTDLSFLADREGNDVSMEGLTATAVDAEGNTVDIIKLLSSEEEAAADDSGDGSSDGGSTVDNTDKDITVVIDKDEETTTEERTKNVIILQIDNNAAVVSGVLTTVDKDNKEVKPYITDQRTFVPVRFIAESMGATVSWDGNTRQVTIDLNGKKVVMTIGKTSYTIDGVAKQMDTSPVINKGWDRTMVPIRFIAEALGKDVTWDASNRLVIIAPASAPWNAERSAEQELISQALTIMALSPVLNN